jgi:osmotically-inducible protein OsmY
MGHWVRTFTIILAGAALSSTLAAQAEAGAQAPAPDNTKVNKNDRSKTEPTADQAKNNPADKELMRKIRSAIVDDKSLSTYAHNVKVIAQNGKVTLKGPVRSEEEKKAVEAKAEEIAGAGNVKDQLTVKAAKQSAKPAKTS